jgi:Vitamin K-dependent gamma-carboxylase
MPTRPERSSRFDTALFELDTRSLALFRVALGGLVLLDAIGRLGDLTAFYTDAGAVPRALVDEMRGDVTPLSLYLLDGSALWVGGLLALHALAGLGLALGYWTRLATAVAWLLTFSIQHRNLFVENFGDVILRLLLFWSLFLPLAARASLDARGTREPPPRGFASFGSAGFIVQLLCVYLFTALLKTGTTWQDGSAIAISLENDTVAKLPQAAIALGYPHLLVFLTYAVRAFEAVAPLLLLVPFALGPLRTALVFVFWSFHLGLFALLELGMFPFVCIVAWIAVLPGWFWDRIGVPAGSELVVRRRQWLALAALVLVVASNVSTLFPDTPYPPLLGVPLRVSGLYQRWKMFAPNPSRRDGWVIADGRRADGADEDLLNGGPVSWEKPAEVSSYYPSSRWAYYMRAVTHRRPPVRQAFARWLCRRENAHREDGARIARVSLHYLVETEPAPGDPPEIRHAKIWDEDCSQN